MMCVRVNVCACVCTHLCVPLGPGTFTHQPYTRVRCPVCTRLACGVCVCTVCVTVCVPTRGGEETLGGLAWRSPHVAALPGAMAASAAPRGPGRGSRLVPHSRSAQAPIAKLCTAPEISPFLPSFLVVTEMGHS